MNGLRILHISDGYPGITSEYGGAEVITERLIRLFDRADLQQGLLVASAGPMENTPGSLHISGCQTLEELLPEFPSLTAIKAQLIPADPLAVRGVLASIKSFRPHVVLLHNIRKFTLQAAELCRFLDIYVCAMVYDYVYFCPTGMFVTETDTLCRTSGDSCLTCHPAQAKSIANWSRMLLPKRKAIIHPMLDAVDRFIVLSKASKELLCDAGVKSQRISVINQPLSLHSDSPPEYIETDPNAILFIGWVQPRKGLLQVVRALHHVHKPFSFKAIGSIADTAYADKVRQEMVEIGLDPDQCLQGRVTGQDLTQAIHQSGIVVIAEQWENMSPAILHESMAAAKTIIAGDIGGISEFITHRETGYLVPYNRPKEYARQLDELLGNTELQKIIGENASRAVHQYADPGAILHSYMEIFSRAENRFSKSRIRSWLDSSVCVIICGGKGTRLRAVKGDTHKSLVEVCGKPILHHIIEYWAQFVDRFFLITGRDSVKDISEATAKLPYSCTIRAETRAAGVATALLEAASDLQGRFVMVLGDCLYQGNILLPPAMDRGVAYTRSKSKMQTQQNFSVLLDNSRKIKRLVEKPHHPAELCGMGVYFLDNSVFRAIRETPPDKSGHIQITSVMQTLADTIGLFGVPFEGRYININYPQDLEAACGLFTSAQGVS